MSVARFHPWFRICTHPAGVTRAMYSIRTRRRHQRCNMSYLMDSAGPSTNVLHVSVFRELHETLARAEALAAVYRKFIENAALFINELPVQDAAARIDT